MEKFNNNDTVASAGASTTSDSKLRSTRTALLITLLSSMVAIQIVQEGRLNRMWLIDASSFVGQSSTMQNPLCDGSAANRSSMIPLSELTHSNYTVCHNNPAFRRIENSIPDHDPTIEEGSASSSKIPKIVHVTAKTRCAPDALHNHIHRWRMALPNHSIYFHDDMAMDRLFYEKDWPEFPHLRQGMQCLISGAAKADLWRALLLYEYGGIYADIDSAPNAPFNSTTIANDDEAFFVVEWLGITSQYFMAAAPHHPLFFLLVQMTLHRLYDVSDVNTQYVPFVTGPGALKNAMIHYMGKQGPQPEGASPYETFQKVAAGLYHGVVGNSSVRVVGQRSNSDEYIIREALPGKRDIYKQMGMIHFGQSGGPMRNESCLLRVLANLPNAE